MTVTGATKASKYVLSIDGGGFRGYACLVMLYHLTKQLPANSDCEKPLPCQVFDVICGTSTGGLIAVLLGRLGLDCLKAMFVYKELVTALFTGVDEQEMRDVDGDERDFPEAFEQKLAAIVEKYTGSKDALMKIRKTRPDNVDHLSTDTFVTVVPPTAGAAGARPYHVRSYTAPRGDVESVVKHDWTIREAIRAAMALPGYFRPVGIGSQSFQDAALSGSANPVWDAITEVEERWSGNVDPSITSLGTGLVSLFPIDPEEEPLDTFSKQLTRVAKDTELKHREARKHFTDKDLANNYIRFDPTGGLGDISEVAQFSNITALTNVWLGTPEGREEISRASRALQDWFHRSQSRNEPQQEIDADPNGDPEPSGALEGQPISMAKSNNSKPEREIKTSQHLEEDSDSESRPEPSVVPEGHRALVVQGDTSNPEQQVVNPVIAVGSSNLLIRQHPDGSDGSDHHTQSSPPKAEEAPPLVHKDSLIKGLKKFLLPRQTNRPAQMVRALKDKTGPNPLKRISNLKFLGGKGNAVKNSFPHPSTGNNISSAGCQTDAQKAGHESSRPDQVLPSTGSATDVTSSR